MCVTQIKKHAVFAVFLQLHVLRIKACSFNPNAKRKIKFEFQLNQIKAKRVFIGQTCIRGRRISFKKFNLNRFAFSLRAAACCLLFTIRKINEDGTHRISK